MKEPNLKDYANIVSVACTPSLFEAIIQSKDGTENVHIRNDGLTWLTKSSK